MKDYRQDFPIFQANPKLVYLDSAATSQKPEVVINAVEQFWRTGNAPVHRGLYPLSTKATESYEQARETVGQFLGARSSREIVFTRSATEALNLLASSLSSSWGAGDTLILSEAEHHSNLVPWQQVAAKTGLKLRFAKVTKTGEIDLEDFRALIDESVVAVSITHCSNVLGRSNPVAELKKILRKQGSQAILILDACQSAPHCPLSVSELSCDFLVFSGHKLYAPAGIGVLWGKGLLLESLLPYQTGGEMVNQVSLQKATWNQVPWRFEAGTPNVEGAIGLAAAIKYIQKIDLAKVITPLAQALRLAIEAVPGASLLGDPEPESGIVSFTIEGIHPHDLASWLGEKGICIRAGQHCAAPLHDTLGIVASNRASLGVYNTPEDIARFAEVLMKVVKDYRRA